MALELVTPPAAPTTLVTVDELKIHARTDPSMGTLEDALLGRLIGAAVAQAEEFTMRQFLTATWRLVLDEFPCWELRIPKPPLTAKPVVKYLDPATGAELTLDPTLYDADLPSGPMAARGAIVPGYMQTWPIPRSVINAVRVEFTAGYGAAAAVPDAIKQGILQIAAEAYKRREDALAGTIITPVPMSAHRWLFPFRAW